MGMNLSGKFWSIPELEKKFGVPAYKLYPILNSMKGVVRIGYNYLMPDFLMPFLTQKLDNKKLYTLHTAARLTNSSPGLIKLLITNGLPCSMCGFDDLRIDKKIIPVLKDAIAEVKGKEKEINKTDFAMEVVKLVEKYLDKQKRS